MSQNGNDFFFSLIGYLSHIIGIFVWLVGFISSMEQGKKQNGNNFCTLLFYKYILNLSFNA